MSHFAIFVMFFVVKPLVLFVEGFNKEADSFLLLKLQQTYPIFFLLNSFIHSFALAKSSAPFPLASQAPAKRIIFSCCFS